METMNVNKAIIKEGFLLHQNQSAKTLIFRNGVSLYFVLKRGSLDCYTSKLQNKFKQSYPLAFIKSAEAADNSSLKISFTTPSQTDLILHATDDTVCREWLMHLNQNIDLWRYVDNEEENCCSSNDKLCFPSEFAHVHLEQEYKSIGQSLLHQEFLMIKYARNGKTIPHERIFKLGFNNLSILWKSPRSTQTFNCNKSSLLLKDIIEIRCGQQTKNFELFPYVEVEKQSLSLIFEKSRGEWCGISSLDIICDSVAAFNQWKNVMGAMVYGHENVPPLKGSIIVIDPFLSFLKSNWSCMAEKDGHITIDIATQFMKRFFKKVKKNSIRQLVKNVSHGSFIDWDCFHYVFNMLNEKPQIFEYYKKYSKLFPNIGMTVDEFRSFLLNEQKLENINLRTVSHLIRFHDKENSLYKCFNASDDPHTYKTSTSLLSFYGFLSYLRSSDNALLRAKQQDMTRPLSHYFIKSSHNTYLTGHQLKGLSSCEAYVYALLNGFRSLEIDCWDGAEEPIVTHGMTLTTKIRLRDVLEVIKAYAFDKSPYPLILSLENHCSGEQQKIMADLFVSIFGDELAVEDLSHNNTLPSPEELKYKIILKGHPQQVKKKSLVKMATKRMTRNTRKKSRSSSSSSVESNIWLRRETEMSKQMSMSEFHKEEDTRQVLLEDYVGNLIVYCRSVPYKRDEPSWNCCEMHSFNENMAIVLSNRHPEEILSLSYEKFIRSYPKGTRVDSSNYNPITMWAMGIQMAAVNAQKPDFGFHINNGFFRQTDTGYVLKPDPLTNQGEEDVFGNDLILRVDIKILCGQFVYKQDFLGLPVLVELEMVGIKNDSNIFSTEPCDNVIDPCWQQNQASFDVEQPNMCVLYIKLFTVARVNKLIYQYSLPVDCINPGVRYIPMFTPTDVSRDENGLFVYIDLSHQQQQQRKQRDANRTDLPRKRFFTT